MRRTATLFLALCLVMLTGAIGAAESGYASSGVPWLGCIGAVLISAALSFQWMARQDLNLQLATAQSFTASAATTNIYDAAVARDLGQGRGLSVYVRTTVNADHTTGDETYGFALRTSATQTSGAIDGTIVVLEQWTVLYSELVTTKFPIELPISENLAFLKYIDVEYIGGGTTPTWTGDIWIGERQTAGSNRVYSSGVTP